MTWESLPATTDMKRAIDTAVTSGAIPRIPARRQADPPILLPHAEYVFDYRTGTGTPDAAVAEPQLADVIGEVE